MTAPSPARSKDFVRNAPLADVQKVLAGRFMPTESFRIPFTVTFVQMPSKLVVFDAGNGMTPPGATADRMNEKMKVAKIDPAKVTPSSSAISTATT